MVQKLKRVTFRRSVTFLTSSEQCYFSSVKLLSSFGDDISEMDNLYYARGRQKRGLWRRSLSNTSPIKEEPVLDSLQEWGWWALGPGVVYFFEEPRFINPRVRLKALNLVDAAYGSCTRFPLQC